MSDGTIASAPARADPYPPVLLGCFIAIWIALGVTPRYPGDWLLENVLVFLVLPVLPLTYRRFRFSNFAYTCLFAFLVLHEIGAHYTYSEVPYDAWFRTLTGTTVSGLLGLERNHYDRLVHFAYGFLMFPLAWELIDRRASPRGAWRYVLPVTFLMSHSVIYELVEWTAAEIFGGDLGQAYLGTQGDVWDAQKDMALAAAGAVTGLALTALARRRPPA